jgi:hypothetical protein
MIRCVRIWTGDDRNSHFEEGVIDLEPGARGDMLSGKMATTTISFEDQTAALCCPRQYRSYRISDRASASVREGAIGGARRILSECEVR